MTGRVTVEIIPSNPRDISIIGANMREHDRREFEASALFPSMSTAALMCHYASPDWAWVALLDDEPAGAIGIVRNALQPQLGAAWAFGTDRFKRVVPALSVLAATFRNRLVSEGVHRIEARCIVGHDLAGRWMAGLGASRETVLRRYGVNGEDFELWAWTDEE